MKLSYPVQTVQGEQVMIVDKAIDVGDSPRTTTVLTSEDGRKFVPSGNSLYVREIDTAEEAEASEPTETE